MRKIEELKKMYANNSKHSNYQVLASELEEFLNSKELITKSRNEQIRLEYFLKNVDIKNKTVLDIGGNTGYFTFELLSRGAKSVDYYEGNIEHSKFVTLASEVLNRKNQINVYNEYYCFNKSNKFDIVLLLNHNFNNQNENLILKQNEDNINKKISNLIKLNDNLKIEVSSLIEEKNKLSNQIKNQDQEIKTLKILMKKLKCIMML